MRTRHLVLFFVALSLLAVKPAVLAEVNHDDVEALHASWLLDQGRTPYQDFFEKQAPVFWHLLRPVIWLSEPNTELAILGGRAMMFLFYIATLVGVWKLARESLKDERVALVAPGLVALSTQLTDGLAIVRPDGLMVCLVVWGTWFLTSYLKLGRSWRLGISGFLFGTASVLLLKAVPFSAALFAFLIFYLWRKWQMWHVLAGLVGYVLPVGIFAAWLWATGQFAGFWFTNVIFNGALYTSPPPDEVMGLDLILAILRFTLQSEPWILVLPVLVMGVVIWKLVRRELPLVVVPSLALLLVGGGILAVNRLPFHSYFVLPSLAAIIIAPWAGTQILMKLNPSRGVQLMGTVWRRFVSVRVLLAGLLIAVVCYHGMSEISQLPTSEGQMEKIVSAQPMPDGLYRLPYHPIFREDMYRIWDNHPRYVYVFRCLHEQGQVPEWAEKIYGPEYLPATEVACGP